MKRPTAVALLLSAMVLPACAQHGGGHGGFSGGGSHGGFSSHAGAAPAFHSGFASRPSAPAFSARAGGMRPGYAPGAAAGARRAMPMRDGAQPLHYGVGQGYEANRDYGTRDGHRPPYRRPNRGGIIYEYPYAGLGNYYYGDPYGLGFYGDYGDDGYDSSADYSDPNSAQAAPYYAPDQYNGFDPQAQGQGPAQAWPQGQGMAQLNPDTPYRPYYGAPHPVSSQTVEPVVTLVFKDHRPNQQIHNYLINGDTLTIWDEHPHEIALDQLDIAATEKINHDAGTDILLPGAPK